MGNGNVKDFKAPAGIPIVGQQPPAEVLDGLSRPLRAGDRIILTTKDLPTYRVASVSPVPEESRGPGEPPGMMEIRLESIHVFRTPRMNRCVEFCRIQTREEIDAQKDERV